MLIDAERDDAALERHVGDDDDVAIAAITVAELLVGVELADRRRRPRRERYVTELLHLLPLESYGLDVAKPHAQLLADTRRTGATRGAHDLIIAATALARDREIVSSDASAFGRLPSVCCAASDRAGNNKPQRRGRTPRARCGSPLLRHGGQRADLTQ